MFSSNVHLLPSLYYYEDVKKYYEDTPPHKRKKWEPNQRGLDGANKWHYRIEKHSDTEYWVCLYETPIVKWFGPERVIVDVRHGSTLTVQFAHKYTWALGTVYNHESRTVFEVDGIKWQALQAPFEFTLLDTPPGAPKHLRKYALVSTHEKVKRKVLDPDKALEYRQASREFKRWVRGVWAMSGNDGTHPWTNAPKDSLLQQRMVYEGWSVEDKERWEDILKFGLLTMRGNAYTFLPTYDRCNVEDPLRAIDKHYQKDMYIEIDYDAPLPKRSK